MYQERSYVLALKNAQNLDGMPYIGPCSKAAPRCPHLGCTLSWNRQERSWGCTCHGSRFAKDGRLLDNPAVKDLKRK